MVTPTMTKTCFVISPIAGEDSAIRKEADQLLWVIRQVVEKYGYRAVRVDEVCQSVNISEEIKVQIRNAELCVCVLTHSNPNVFYETGLRHSTGKPYIHLMATGQTIPFDVNNVNTIFYDDLNSFESATKLSERLTRFVKDVPETERDRDKIDVILEAVSQIYEIIKKQDASSRKISSKTLEAPYSTRPYDGFMLAIAQGDADEAEVYFEKLTKTMDQRQLLASAGYLADAGSRIGPVYIIENIEDSGLEPIEQVVLVSTVVNYVAQSEDEELAQVALSHLSRLGGFGGEVRITSLNQKQKLLYGIGRYEEALEICEEVLQLAPDEPSYWFNASLIYEKLKLFKKAHEAVEKMLELQTDDPDHLKHAVQFFSEQKLDDKAQLHFKRLMELSPNQAKILSLDVDVRRALGLGRR
jgi:tetratricopeptide (TPR) repeat protein